MPRQENPFFKALHFMLVRTGNKYKALCLYCRKYLCNTAAERLKRHRSRCQRSLLSAQVEAKLTTDEVENNVSEYLNIILPSEKKPTKPQILNKETKTNAEDYLNFFNYDTLTKYVSCKYCSKKYKKNATRMQEHLATCEPFRNNTEVGGPDYRFQVRSKSRTVTNDSESNSHDDQVSIENVSTNDVTTLSCESELISVEHGYNSESTTATPNSSERFQNKKRKKDSQFFNHNSQITHSQSSSHVPYSDECRDEFDIFGEHVASELRKLRQNPVLLTNTKHELNNILHKSVIENYKNEEFVSVFIN